MYLPGDRLSTVPTTLRPNGACPTATATAATTTHTHTGVCVRGWSQQQQRAAGESPTRSFGVCTANQTRTHSLTIPVVCCH